jgi:hypothetical protein
MSDELIKHIENHLATFPERHNDYLEMKAEWQEFKRKALYILVSFLGVVVAYGVWVGTIQSNNDEFEKTDIQTKAEIKVIESRINSLEVNNSEIRARLTSIDLALQEIKAAIRQLK